MIKPELLAPAGNEKCAYAAVQSGADSIYMGMLNFGARSYAENFDNDALKRVVNYCKIRGVKVYVTLNTLISDKELIDALECAKVAANCGVDGFIVQDAGLIFYIKKFFPEVAVHISTQSNVLNSSAVEFSRQLGGERCVVGRELSYEEIKNIVNKSASEIEIFVHGAQCYCYSGQCLMSSIYGGRSGNRGKCAGPCRMPYKLEDQKGKVFDEGYLLSPVDMCLGRDINRVLNTGASCLKIEGRMKGPEYVAACSKIYKNALLNEQNITKKELEILENTFSRGGFTSGLFDGKDNKIKKESSNDDAYKNQQEDILAEFKNIYKENLRKTPAKMVFIARIGGKAILKFKAFGKEFSVESKRDVEAASSAPIGEERIKNQLEKLGDYPFYAENIEVNICENVFMPISEINSMRREAAEKAICALTFDRNYNKITLEKNKTFVENKTLLAASVLNDEQLKAVIEYSEIDEIYYPAIKYKKMQDSRIVPVFPAIIREKHLDKYKNILENLKNMGVKKVKVNEWGIFHEAKKLGFDIVAGEDLNIFNSASAHVFAQNGAVKVALSPEMNISQISNLSKTVPYEVMVYGRVALMKTANCPLKGVGVCGKNSDKFTLIDRMNEKIPIICSCSDCTAYLYNSTPIYMADKKEVLPQNIKSFLLSFTSESPEECRNVIESWNNSSKMNGKFTRGHFQRGVL